MFLAGANHAAEFRLASYVHVVRWWWRFLALDRFGGEREASFWEAVLFGWSAKPFGRKRVSFRLLGIVGGNFNSWGTPEVWRRKWTGINYLTAQGLSDRTPAPVVAFRVEARMGRLDAKNLTLLLSDVLKPDQWKFALDQLGEHVDSDVGSENWRKAVTCLVDAMALVGLLGGLGARSRRGFGSLAVSELRVAGEKESRIDGRPETVEEYRKHIETHLHGNTPIGGTATCGSLPRYTAYSKEFSAHICASATDAQDLMNDIGWAFQIYRSWGQAEFEDYRDAHGRNKKRKTGRYSHELRKDGARLPTVSAGPAKSPPVVGNWYKREFADDHDEFYQKSLRPDRFDNRAVFGLPHNYGNTDVGWDLPGDNSYSRRASPLLFHVHKVAGRYLFVASIVESKFAPDSGQLHAKRGPTDHERIALNANVDWSLIRDFVSFLRGTYPNMPRSPVGGAIHTSYTPEMEDIH